MTEKEDKIPKPPDCAIRDCTLVEEYKSRISERNNYREKNISLKAEKEKLVGELKKNLTEEQKKEILEEVQKNTMIEYLQRESRKKDLENEKIMDQLNDMNNANVTLKSELDNIETADTKNFKIDKLDNNIIELEQKKSNLSHTVENFEKQLTNFSQLINMKGKTLLSMQKEVDRKQKENKTLIREINDNFDILKNVKMKSSFFRYFIDRKERKIHKKLDKIKKLFKDGTIN